MGIVYNSLQSLSKNIFHFAVYSCMETLSKTYNQYPSLSIEFLCLSGRLGYAVLYVVSLLCVPDKNTTPTFQRFNLRDRSFQKAQSLQTRWLAGGDMYDQNC